MINEKEILQHIRATVEASRKTALLDESDINAVLLNLADEAEANTAFILEENQKDLDRICWRISFSLIIIW
jgi:glutamate-5-semialdehyde dehydrogenase